MSTLALSTISNLAGTASTSSDNVINGSAKAWVNFNGTGSVQIRAAYNVSSITDNGTGDYTVNFTNAMPDANYCVASVCALSDAIVAGNTNRGFAPRSYTTTTVRFLVTDGVSGVDPLLCNVAIFR
jgi:hypothetical protein